MKIVIIEDENLSAEHLTNLLQKIDLSIAVVNYFDTVSASVAAFNEGLSADLIFMDIHLADGNSFEIFNQVKLEIPVIFTTAFDNYAIQAFKQNSVDYLLKPIALQDLKFAIEKFKKQQKLVNNDLVLSITSAYQQINKEYKTRFLVKLGQTIDTIPTDEIHHFETGFSISFFRKQFCRQMINFNLFKKQSFLKNRNQLFLRSLVRILKKKYAFNNFFFD